MIVLLLPTKSPNVHSIILLGNTMKSFVSAISQKEFPLHERVSAKVIRPSLLAFIQQENPSFNTDNYLTISELNRYRERYLSEYVMKSMGALSDLENKVLRSLQEQSILTDELDRETYIPLSTGQRVADKVATFGGSWTFIISFGVFLITWITSNALWLNHQAFDPYPFILLNLILSCLAAIQAPIIMMSQNRQEEKDRERAKQDYMVNLKAELEIRMLHEKIDHLMMHQQQELLEVQKLQAEMLTDILQEVELLKVRRA